MCMLYTACTLKKISIILYELSVLLVRLILCHACIALVQQLCTAYRISYSARLIYIINKLIGVSGNAMRVYYVILFVTWGKRP